MKPNKYIPNKGLTHERCEDPRCKCGCDKAILERIEQDPNYAQELFESQEIIAKRAREIRKERESRRRHR